LYFLYNRQGLITKLCPTKLHNVLCGYAFSFGECELATFGYLEKNKDNYKLNIKYRE